MNRSSFQPGLWIYGAVFFFLFMTLFSQYRTNGKMNVAGLGEGDTGPKYFWDRNPNLEPTDSYPGTSLVEVRERKSGRTAVLDLLVVSSKAQVETAPCEEQTEGGAEGGLYPEATDAVCFTIHQTGARGGRKFGFATSFRAAAKTDDVGQFYRSLFTGRGLRANVVEDANGALVLEGENEQRNTVARIALGGPAGRLRGFFAVTDEFRSRGR